MARADARGEVGRKARTDRRARRAADGDAQRGGGAPAGDARQGAEPEEVHPEGTEAAEWEGAAAAAPERAAGAGGKEASAAEQRLRPGEGSPAVAALGTPLPARRVEGAVPPARGTSSGRRSVTPPGCFGSPARWWGRRVSLWLSRGNQELN